MLVMKEKRKRKKKQSLDELIDEYSKNQLFKLKIDIFK